MKKKKKSWQCRHYRKCWCTLLEQRTWNDHLRTLLRFLSFSSIDCAIAAWTFNDDRDLFTSISNSNSTHFSNHHNKGGKKWQIIHWLIISNNNKSLLLLYFNVWEKSCDYNFCFWGFIYSALSLTSCIYNCMAYNQLFFSESLPHSLGSLHSSLFKNK